MFERSVGSRISEIGLPFARGRLEEKNSSVTRRALILVDWVEDSGVVAFAV